MRRVYFDHAAATPLLPEALQEMLPFLKEKFGNPQSLHHFGIIARDALERAREQVARLINAKANSIIFTASASESNNLAIKGFAGANRAKGNHIVISAIEHPSVFEPVKSLKRQGFELTVVKVDQFGRVDPKEVAQAIHSGTILVSIMHANNEIGTIQPLKEIVKVCHEQGVLVHSDGTAAVGRIAVDVSELDIDAYSFSAQSFYGPKGVGALYIKPQTRISPLIEGGFQERGRRAGTENLPAIVGMGKAAEICQRNLSTWSASMNRLAQRLRDELPQKIERILFTGHPQERIPGNVSLCIEFVEGEALLLSLDDEGIAAASGSACTARTLKASHVLLAIGLPHAIAQSSLLLTLGKDNTDEDVDYLLARLPAIVERLRNLSPLYARYLKGEDPYAVKSGQEENHKENN
ncbi:MAG: cysteine desulfurase family protein [candidate division WOR-3 bacterium]